VQIILVILWRIVVNDTRHSVDVNASCRNVCCDQSFHSAGAEVLQCTLSSVLRKPAVDGRGLRARLAQSVGQPVCTASCPGEDDSSAGALDERRCVVRPLIAVNQPKVVSGLNGVGIDRASFVPNRVLLEVPHENSNVAVKSRREQKSLASLGCL
jgi:hypothetical protein